MIKTIVINVFIRLVISHTGTPRLSYLKETQNYGQSVLYCSCTVQWGVSYFNISKSFTSEPCNKWFQLMKKRYITICMKF